MTPSKIISVIEMYEKRLEKEGVPRVRMNPDRTFESLAYRERLAHAHYLCAGAKKFAADPEKYGKANRHLAAIQMCLSFAGWYTLDDLTHHNKSD